MASGFETRGPEHFRIRQNIYIFHSTLVATAIKSLILKGALLRKRFQHAF